MGHIDNINLPIVENHYWRQVPFPINLIEIVIPMAE